MNNNIIRYDASNNWGKDLPRKKERKKTIAPSKTLIERLRNEKGLLISDSAFIRSTNASKAWQDSGRWIWELIDPEGKVCIGSDYKIRELLKFPFLSIDYSWGGRVVGYDLDENGNPCIFTEKTLTTP